MDLDLGEWGGYQNWTRVRLLPLYWPDILRTSSGPHRSVKQNGWFRAYSASEILPA